MFASSSPSSRHLLKSTHLRAVILAAAFVITLLWSAAHTQATPAAETYALYLPALARPVDAVALQPYAGGLSQPVAIANAGDDRLFVVERAGRIRVIDANGNTLPEPFLDIRSQVRTDFWEQGLLGLVFAPDYTTSGRFYVYYSLDGTPDEHPPSRLSRFRVDPANPNVALPGSEQVLLTIFQPDQQHKGGDLHFGPDGYLYVSVGDGGRESAAQDLAELRGSILRLDVSPPDDEPYAVPPDNPYVGVDGAMPEIWLDGLRNPWRFSIDNSSGTIYIADVGSDAWEEINAVALDASAGRNFGWPCTEGFFARATLFACREGAPLSEPVFVYDHSNGRCSVSGGHVYRGTDFPGMAGLYMFADFCESTIWAMLATGDISPVREMGRFDGLNPSAFGRDVNGELYVAGYTAGVIYRLTPGGAAP